MEDDKVPSKAYIWAEQSKPRDGERRRGRGELERRKSSIYSDGYLTTGFEEDSAYA